MTREAEVGDHFPNAKVVKTTTFGAFVELVKGTDGLLHISNVKPGERVDAVEDVLSAGDEIDVTVAEVDKERGRIGLRLSDDPAIAGKIARGARRSSAPATRRWAAADGAATAAIAAGGRGGRGGGATRRPRRARPRAPATGERTSQRESS